ncbi:hypothetical protein GCM10010344_03020 [Streptomyces bluensis]|nr:hypothetical protein GCM10010344_03020 [Streptomyces bluensis]
MIFPPGPTAVGPGRQYFTVSAQCHPFRRGLLRQPQRDVLHAGPQPGTGTVPGSFGRSRCTAPGRRPQYAVRCPTAAPQARWAESRWANTTTFSSYSRVLRL